MRAALITDRLVYEPCHPLPAPGPSDALIRVQMAGICQTDLELIKGYMGFSGVPGHEFLGIVERCADPLWVGRRVVGEINAACGACAACAAGLGRHCPNRTVLGILRHDGCMADYCCLPAANLLAVPESVPDIRAVFVEPLSAACEILRQVPLTGTERIVVLGDGRLGILCAWALSTVARDVTLVGHHTEKLERARWGRLQTVLGSDTVSPGADVVVEATGRGAGIGQAMALCRPRGTIVLKSTVALQGEVNLAPLVIDELTVVGSRCGLFRDGIAMIAAHPDMPLERLVTARYPLPRVVEAFEHAAAPESLKIVLEMG